MQLSRCGSCPLLALPYPDQLAQKHASLKAQLAPVLSLLDPTQAPTLRAPVASPDALGYRYSVKLVTQPSERGPRVGLYRPGTHEVIDTQGCPVQSAPINALLDVLRATLKEPGAPSLYDERLKVGALRYIVIREAFAPAGASPELHMTLISREDSAPIRALAQRLTERSSCALGVSVHVNSSDGNAIFDWSSEPLMHMISGGGSLTSLFTLNPTCAPLQLRASVESFSQVNPSAATLAYRAVVEGLSPSSAEVALDLYCGVGSISLALAQAGCAEVIGLEESPSSVRDAQMNATVNKLSARFIEGLTELILPAEVSRLTEAHPLPTPDAVRPVLVSLNPSRRGCQPEVIESLAFLRPRRLAYMSCHPRTLIRDLKRFIARGYQPTSLQLFDLFPGTPHFEVVCVIEPMTPAHSKI